MAEVLLSAAEKTFILHGVEDNLRNDGRNRLDYRPMELETGIAMHLNGSARLRLANTDILVGIKTEIGEPYPEKPNEGKIEFFVDCSANATPAFEGRGGEELATEISSTLARAYQTAGAFSLSDICIIPGKCCWKLYIDILILECGGNLFDAVSLAVKAALYNTSLPKITVEEIEGCEPDIELSDTLEGTRLNVSNAPVLITLCKIGDNCVVDPTAEEEMCSSASVVIATSENGTISSVFKTGVGSLSPQTLNNAVIEGSGIGRDLNVTLNAALQREEDEEETDDSLFRRHYGFLK